MEWKKVVIGAAVCMGVSYAGVALAADSMSHDMMQGDSEMHGSMVPSSVMMMHPPKPMVLQISGDGTGLLRGVVAKVDGQTLTVATWGGFWTIQTVSDTMIKPGAISDIKVGDFIGASGTVSEDTETMTATIVRDWSMKSAMMQDHMMTGASSGAMMHDDHMMSSSSDSMMH